MKLRRQPRATIGILAGALTLAWLVPTAHAQFTTEYQTNIISGGTINSGGVYYVHHPYDFLHIDSGGTLIDTSGYVDGSLPTGLHGILYGHAGALVTDPGSVWSNLNSMVVGQDSPYNSLVISNGGRVVCMFDGVAGGGFGEPGNSNSVVVTGPGSIWSVSNEMTIGQSGGSGNSLLISNGGQVFDRFSRIGDVQGVASNNSVVVTDPGSVWSVGDHVDVAGFGGGNSLTVNNGGLVWASLIGVGSANSITLGGGILSVTNQLSVGSNAVVSGCGTINGSVLTYAGGTVEANCGGPLTFTGIVTNNGTMRAIDGSVLESYGTVVNNGIIDIINGTTNFHGTFINNGTVLDPSSVRISNIALAGDDVSIQIDSVTCHTYQVQITPSFSPTTWSNSCPAQAGTGGVLTFTDPGGATNQPTRFYRILVGDP